VNENTCPPLAWELIAKDGPHGDATWTGGAAIKLNTGPGLRGLLEPRILPLLARGDPGPALTEFFAQLREISGGAVWARPVERAKVIAVLGWDAAMASDGNVLVGNADPTARYKHNKFPAGLDPAAVLAATRAGAIIWEPTAPPGVGYKAGGVAVDGKNIWLTVSPKSGGKAMIMAITAGPAERPQVIEQADGFFGRCDLSKLFELLGRTAANPSHSDGR
jgi:hypothetical protein